MKVLLKDIINTLEMARQRYIKKHGLEPTLWGEGDDEGTVRLCSGISVLEYGHEANKPYMEVKCKKLLDRLT